MIIKAYENTNGIVLVEKELFDTFSSLLSWWSRETAYEAANCNIEFIKRK